MASFWATTTPSATTPRATAAPIPLRQIAPWAAFSAVLAIVLLYFVGSEQGIASVFAGQGVHEYVHDGRHLLGFPCH